MAQRNSKHIDMGRITLETRSLLIAAQTSEDPKDMHENCIALGTELDLRDNTPGMVQNLLAVIILQGGGTLDLSARDLQMAGGLGITAYSEDGVVRLKLEAKEDPNYDG